MMADLNLNRVDFKELAAGILQKDSALRFRAPGSSMAPFIRSGDLLEVRPIGREPVRRGDVLLCTLDTGRVVAHRVVQIGHQDAQETFLIQGDSLLNPDGFVSRQNVLGRVAAIERDAKRVAKHGANRLELNTASYRLLSALWIGLAPLSKRLYLGASGLKAILIRNFSRL